MRTSARKAHQELSALALGAMLLWLGVPRAAGQLAITEVMSQESTNVLSDYWELTNFGEDPIDLANYYFTDKDSLPRVPLIQAPYTDLFIGPRESIVFVRTDKLTNEAQFRAWWGPCLSESVQVRFYPKTPGFDAGLDGVRLYDPGGGLVDRVDFGFALRGVSFVYDTNSGGFGSLIALGSCGACRAASANDIGSPGTTCGPVPLSISEHPTDREACAGAEATFAVSAYGLPRPKYQWLANGTAIPGATSARLTITNTRPADAGRYEVEVGNGLTALRSSSARLTVRTNPSSPGVLVAPADVELYAGQTARFSVTVCAYPPASYQWFANGLLLEGATDRTLTIPNCGASLSGSRYEVRIQNPLGAANAQATLEVTAKPELRITELMAADSTNCPAHADWFELTNLGSNAVNLLGYRFSDRFSLEGAATVTQAEIVAPGESVIFVERMTADEFIGWWGADNLPPGLKINTYVGLGFAAIPTESDGLYLWNAAAEDPSDVLDSKSYAVALHGVSLCPSSPDPFTFLDVDSIAGEAGAFPAAACGEIGSPGYITNPPLRILRVSHEPSGVTVTWRTIPGRTYRLKRTNHLPDGAWTLLSTSVATSFVHSIHDGTVGNGGQMFYEVEEVSSP